MGSAVVWVAVLASACSTSASTSPPTAERHVANTPVRSITVQGNRILEPGGRQYIPYGFVTYCLAEKDPDCGAASTSQPVTDNTKITQAAMYWHANTIRIQVAEANLVPSGTVNQMIMNQLKSQVELVNSLGMVAIITDQEEYFDGPPLPTSSAVPFWNAVASTFKDDQRVFFDLYNEPRLAAAPGQGMKSSWNFWRNGGIDTISGITYDFVGMQPLVNDIRSDGADNIIVAEGLKADKSLTGIPQYALTGGKIAYGMEPDLTPTDDTPAQWASNWGDLSRSVPIMMEAFQDWSGSGTCNTNSPTLLPKLLSYLRSKRLGLISWALVPGVMMIGDDPDDPTTYSGSQAAVCYSSQAAPTTAISVPSSVTLGLTGKAARRAERQAERQAENQAIGRQVKDQSVASNTNGPGELILSFFRANSHPIT